MMRMRPGRSVRKMRPSGANSASHGICRSPTTASTWTGVCPSAAQPLPPVLARGAPDCAARKLRDAKPGPPPPAPLDGPGPPVAGRLKPAYNHREGTGLAGPGVGPVNPHSTPPPPADPYRDVEAII